MVGYKKAKLNVILTIVPDNFRLEYCFGEDTALPRGKSSWIVHVSMISSELSPFLSMIMEPLSDVH